MNSRSGVDVMSNTYIMWVPLESTRSIFFSFSCVRTGGSFLQTAVWFLEVMEGKQLSLFLCTVVSLIITTLVVVARCLVRRSIKGFGIDDWTMLAGQV